MSVSTGTLTGLNSKAAWGPFPCGTVAIQLTGAWTATVQVQMSLDGGATYGPASTDGTGAASAITAPTTVYVPIEVNGLYVQIQATAYTSGTVSYAQLWSPVKQPIQLAG